jgi:hypothetical protein
VPGCVAVDRWIWKKQASIGAVSAKECFDDVAMCGLPVNHVMSFEISFKLDGAISCPSQPLITIKNLKA